MTKPNHNIDHLRAVLFDIIDGVKGGTIPLEQAKMVAELTQVVVNSAKVEVDFIRATNGAGKASGFIGEQEPPALPTPATNDDLPRGITGVTQHRIADKE